MSEEAEVEVEGGGGKVFLILGLLLGIGVGGGAGYYFSSQNGGDTSGEQSEAQKEAAKPKEPLISIPFERVAVPIYSSRGNKRRFIGNYFVHVDVQVHGETNQIAVKRSISQLTHGFISAISKTSLMHEDSPTELDLDKASDILKKKAESILGAGIIEHVAITEAVRMPR